MIVVSTICTVRAPLKADRELESAIGKCSVCLPQNKRSKVMGPSAKWRRKKRSEKNLIAKVVVATVGTIRAPFKISMHRINENANLFKNDRKHGADHLGGSVQRAKR